MAGYGYCYYPYAGVPSGYGGLNWFPLIVVLFILLIIIGACCWGNY
ncbi:YjcZ family sporulation protein [Bacillus sp. T33-2]